MSLAKVWDKVGGLLDQNLSLIPVRDKDDGSFLAKMPYAKWRQFQTRRATKDELWHEMEVKDTSAVAIVCGKVSGGLEVIDIDVKWKEGVGATVFALIQNTFPDLFAKLRVHKTPSEGYHILYKIANPPETFPGNMKLAGRVATEEELAEKPKSKVYNFIETRGEGGYVLAPPSLNYTVRQDVDIPLISWEDRCNIINLCKSLHEVEEYKPTYKPRKTDDEYYEESPWNDYNNRIDAVHLLQSFGWKATHGNSVRTYFTRPDKDKGISGSWNHSYGIFWPFTSSTEFEPDKGYRAVDILKLLQFNGDAKECYRYLVENGYGKVKSNIERQIVKKASVKKLSLPANFSDEAKEEFSRRVEEAQQAHPYGKFWGLNDKDRIVIDRERLYQVAKGLGFYTHNDEVVQVVGIFIHKRTNRQFYDEMKAYVQESDEDVLIEICNAYEAYIQQSGRFTIERLSLLPVDDILKDDNHTAYKFYQNCFIEITKDGVKEFDYDLVTDKLIWQDSVFKREWDATAPEVCKYVEFLNLSVGISPYLKTIIGYLSHDYKDENTGYIITLTEQCPDPKQGGGSGKNIFGNLFRHCTSVCTVSGAQVQFNEKLLQSWNGERIFFMADVSKKFDYGFFKEISSGYGVVKKLFKDERSVAPSEMPKILINTNFSYDASDGGIKRRILPVEFTNFFTLAGGVDVHFNGCLFPSGWSSQDWVGFDHFIAESLQEYFKCNGKISPAELSATGWEKQFRQAYGDITYQFIEQNINEWLQKSFITHSDFNRDYELFCQENRVQKQFQLTNILMTKALTQYCEKHEIIFNPQKQKRDHTNSQVRGKEFDKSLPF